MKNLMVSLTLIFSILLISGPLLAHHGEATTTRRKSCPSSANSGPEIRRMLKIRVRETIKFFIFYVS